MSVMSTFIISQIIEIASNLLTSLDLIKMKFSEGGKDCFKFNFLVDQNGGGVFALLPICTIIREEDFKVYICVLL